MGKTTNTIISLCFFVYAGIFSAFSELHVSEIHNLLDQCASSDAIVVYNAISALKKYKLKEFDDTAKQKMRVLLKKETKHLSKFVKLVGFVGMEEDLRAFAQKDKYSKSLRQALNLSLARAGNKEKIASLLRGIKKLKTDDSFSYDAVPSLVYVRQKKIMDKLLDRIMEKGTPCSPPDMETNGKVSCAYSIIEQIAPYIVDFPVTMDKYGIVADDYPAMLQDVRKWIKRNKKNYTIINNMY